MSTAHEIDVASLAKDCSASGAHERYWRSLEELAQTPEFLERLQREFPTRASEWDSGGDRRNFLKLMAASLSLAGITGCVKTPQEKIVPYVRAPEEIIPGKPLFFATAMPWRGYGMGALVESHMGRPTKVEGNPEHPASLGATNAFMQASVLSLYDPDRSQTVSYRGTIETWDRLITALAERMSTLRGTRGAGLRILTETVTSPTLIAGLRALLEELPEARWHQYSPAGLEPTHEAARLALGSAAEPLYRFNQARVIVSLDADFLTKSPASVRYARDFIEGRRVTDRAPASVNMNRLYVAEVTPTVTGAMADHRLPLKSNEIARLALAIAGRLGVEGVSRDSAAPASIPASWLNAVVTELQANRGASLMVAGERQPPAVHALVQAINAALGNVGATVLYVEPIAAQPTGAGGTPITQAASLRELADDMRAGRVNTLVMLGGNPVYAASGELDFADALLKLKSRVPPLRIHLSEHLDETSWLCDWHLPAAHYLESWGDIRAFDGTVSIIQPLIAPLYGGRTAIELVSALRGRPERSSFELVQDYWQRERGGENFGDQWRRWVHDGVIPDTQAAPRNLEPRLAEIDLSTIASNTSDVLEFNFAADPTIDDGSFANNGWLQELPKPLTKLVWDNPVLLSQRTAQTLHVRSGDLLRLTFDGRSVRGPAWIMPGHADGAITLYFGYGRTRAGNTGTGIGYNAYTLLDRNGALTRTGIRVETTGRQYQLVTTQDHWSMEGRPIVRAANLAEYQRDPELIQAQAEHSTNLPSLYPEYKYDEGNKWGMVIDQTACIGCNACVTACQAENNVPIVGKTQVARNREMHWLRIDRYYQGDLQNPVTYFQPMLCQQCEKAPCEVVCPVAATVHSAEGLNDMVYNRCVGTRYCSNNCPYKVRRFNFLEYHRDDAPTLALQRNPDVTVRSRGVMEKCTYCVQRINAARIDAKTENRPIRDGEVVTACQAACPTQAIIFGNLNDKAAKVTQRKQLPLNYGVLAELNTQPRTTYLARLHNPNPELAAPSSAESPHGAAE